VELLDPGVDRVHIEVYPAVELILGDGSPLFRFGVFVDELIKKFAGFIIIFIDPVRRVDKENLNFCR
jgi:hypothetical protein